MPHQLKVCCELALTIPWLQGDLPYYNLVIKHEENNSKCQEMCGRVSASLLQVAQGDSSYLMYTSVLLPVDLEIGVRKVNQEVENSVNAQFLSN